MTKRRLIMFAVVLLIVVAINKAMSHRQSEWRGLSESEARSRLDAKLPSRIPDDKRTAISDKVVAKMRDRGMLRDDVADEPATAETAAADTTAETTDDTADDAIDLSGFTWSTVMGETHPSRLTDSERKTAETADT